MPPLMVIRNPCLKGFARMMRACTVPRKKRVQTVMPMQMPNWPQLECQSATRKPM